MKSCPPIDCWTLKKLKSVYKICSLVGILTCVSFSRLPTLAQVVVKPSNPELVAAQTRLEMAEEKLRFAGQEMQARCDQARGTPIFDLVYTDVRVKTMGATAVWQQRSALATR